MRSASAAFARAVAGSHQMVARCDVLFNRAVVAEGLAIVDGGIDYDRTAARLARLDVVLAEPTRIPTSSADILTPFGYELQMWRGIRIGTVDELVPLGVFPIQTSSVDGVSLASSITAYDRSQLVSDARFEDVYQVPAGENFADAIQALIADGVAGLEYLFPSVTFTTPLLTFDAQDDRWEAGQQMAKSIGHELLFDGFGRCMMRPEPVFTATPVAAVSEGTNMVSTTLQLDRTTAYNRVIATSQNSGLGAQFRGVATDDNPASPTYYLGPFGRRPRFFASEFLASDAQCETAAASVLAANLGVARSVNFAAVPDPRFECSDVVLIHRAALNLDDLHIIDTLRIDLSPSAAMSGTTRTTTAA